MASLPLINAHVSLGGNDISSYIENVDLDVSPTTDDDTAMGDTSTVMVATRQEWSFTCNAKNDYADNLLDEILWGIIDARAAVTLLVNPDGSSTSASNPEYSGQVVLTNYKPISGSHGQLSRTPISLQPAGPLSRATT